MKKGRCYEEAFVLMRKAGVGQVIYVARIGNLKVEHAYYVPDTAQRDRPALNQFDNGFPQYPKLTVGQVVDNGIEITEKDLTEIIQASF